MFASELGRHDLSLYDVPSLRLNPCLKWPEAHDRTEQQPQQRSQRCFPKLHQQPLQEISDNGDAGEYAQSDGQHHRQRRSRRRGEVVCPQRVFEFVDRR